MPPKKGTAPPAASAVQQNPPDGMSKQLWDLSKSSKGLVDKLNARDTEEDIQQGCSKREVAKLLWHEAAQRTNAGQQRRKEALDCGALDTALQALQSGDEALVEICAGFLNTLLHEAPESLEKLLAAPVNGVLTLWSIIGTGSLPVQTFAAGCLETLVKAEHTSFRALRLLQGAEWDGLAKALGHLAQLDATDNTDKSSILPEKAQPALLQLLAALLCPEMGQQAASSGASNASQAQKPPMRAAKPASSPAAKPAGRREPAPKPDSLESSRQVLLEKAAQSNIPTALLQICQDSKCAPRSRETAVKLVHALLTGRHWPAHHVCLAGSGCASLVSVLSADMSHASKVLAAATLKDFLLPAVPFQAQTMPTSTGAANVLPADVAKAAPRNAQQAKAQDRAQAPPESKNGQILPEAALHQAKDRISAVMSMGALPILAALLAGVPEGRAAKANSDAVALQLEAMRCLRMLSLSDACKKCMAETRQARVLLPLLTARKDVIRWMARQVLLNIATMEEAAEALERDGAPAYIHGMNILRMGRMSGQAERTSPQLLVLQRKLYESYSQV